MILKKLGLVLALCAALSACATREPQPNLGLYKGELRHWARSGSYEKLFDETARPGLQAVRAAAVHRRTGEKLAVVLDIDETSLSNWRYLASRDFAVSWPTFADWVRAHDDPAFPVTRVIYDEAKKAGIAVFFITGRKENLRRDTIRQLKAGGYQNWDGLLMKPDAYAESSVVPFKSGARQGIERQGYRIILNMGDQWSDLEGGYAEKTVKLPNPFYFIR